MSSVPEAGWLNLLIGLLQGVQLQLLRGLDALGLVQHAHGQPAWPWALRLSGENLLIDLGQARRLGLTVVLLAAALLVLLLALLWRRRSLWLVALATLLVLAAPWPEAHVVLVPAYPTSFQKSPTGFTADSIERGRTLYAAQCAACHGTDGRGQGPLAASQPVWPPDLAGPLLWRRADGDVLWHVLNGMRERRNGRETETMPAFGHVLRDGDAWALIDFMKAQGAGESLRAAGLWTQPIAPPDVSVQCKGQPPRMLSSWRGQRMRIVAAGGDGLLEDPRMVTVYLQPVQSGTAAAASGDCIADSPAAWAAFSLIAATDKLAGTQLIVDRDGWLRARGEPGKGAWSDDDLLCRTDTPARANVPRAANTQRLPPDGLGALIARMDAEPVRFVKGGFVH